MSTSNPYAPPVADEAPATAAEPIPADALPVFPTSTTKLVVLHLATFAIYPFYWNYKHWQARMRSGEDVSPFWRAVFSIFFIHRLTRSLAGVLGTAPANGAATAFVLLAIVARIGDRLQVPLLWLAGLLLCIPLAVIQNDVNRFVAEHYPTADRNERFTVTNIVLIVLGAIVWVIAAAGLAMGAGE